MTNAHLPDEEARVERLDYLIDQYYGMRGPDVLTHIARDYEHETMAMIEVRHVLTEGIVAEDFDEVVYAPVIVPSELRLCLAPGDVFLVTLGYRHGAWHVLHMSSRYEPMFDDQDDEEVWDESPLH